MGTFYERHPLKTEHQEIIIIRPEEHVVNKEDLKMTNTVFIFYSFDQTENFLVHEQLRNRVVIGSRSFPTEIRVERYDT